MDAVQAGEEDKPLIYSRQEEKKKSPNKHPAGVKKLERQDRTELY